MGVALFIVAEKNVPGLDTFLDGKGLGRRSDALDQLARAAGVRPLMDFFSMDPDEAADYGDPDPQPEEWFPAADGLATVRGLLAHLADHPGAVPEAEWVVGNLEEFETVLAALDAEGVRWHLMVGA